MSSTDISAFHLMATNDNAHIFHTAAGCIHSPSTFLKYSEIPTGCVGKDIYKCVWDIHNYLPLLFTEDSVREHHSMAFI